MSSGDNLRAFSALLGWTRDDAINHALRSLDLAAAYSAHLVHCGAGDLVPIASALHRRTLGTDVRLSSATRVDETRPRRFDPPPTTRTVLPHSTPLAEDRYACAARGCA